MHICFVSFEYPPFHVGGGGVYAQKIIKELTRLGHQLYVISATFGKKKTEEIIENQKIVRIPITNLPSLRFISFQAKLRKTIFSLEREAEGFDVIHFNDPSQLITVPCRPSVVTIHHSTLASRSQITDGANFKSFITGELNPFNSIIERRTLKKVSRIISVSNATKSFIVNRYNLPEEKVQVVHNGVDAENYISSPEEIKDTRKKFAAKYNEKLILSTPGRIDDPRKGIKYLLLAVRNILPLNNNIKCIITGLGSPVNLKKYLDDTIANKVCFTGFINEDLKRRLIASCDLFVFPSLLEGMPLSILEVMAAGKPIISTNVGGIPELIRDGRNGILVEPKNPKRLGETIMELLLDTQKSEFFSASNYYDSRNLFSWEKSAKLTEKIYLDLLTKN